MGKIKIILIFLVIGVCTVPGYGQSINWMSLSKAQERSAEDIKKVLIYAEAEWCGYCKKMDAQVFPKQSVQDSLEKYFHSVRIDIESGKKVTFNSQEMTEQELARKFRVTATPTTIFVNSDGDIIGAQPGFLPAHIFDKLVAFVGSNLTGTISFEEYLQNNGVEL